MSVQIQRQTARCPGCGKLVMWAPALKPAVGGDSSKRTVTVLGMPCCGKRAVSRVEFTEGQVECSTRFENVPPPVGRAVS